MKRKRKASDHPVNTAPAALAAAKAAVKQERGGDGKELNWVQKDAQVHREKLGGLVAELTDLTEPDFDDCDMLAQVLYRLGLVEAFASFADDGTPQTREYKSALAAFGDSVQARTRILELSKLDDEQRLQQRRGLQATLATMVETSDSHEDFTRSAARYGVEGSGPRARRQLQDLAKELLQGLFRQHRKARHA